LNYGIQRGIEFTRSRWCNHSVSPHPLHLVLVAGPNGAGKSTTAPHLLQGALAVDEFVNADVIASGLSAFRPESAAMAAGRTMLDRLRVLASRRKDFAFETTLASRSLAPWIRELKASGYAFHLLFLWLSSADAAVARVRERVSSGGHAVPEETVRRRFVSGLANFFHVYRPLATTWRIYDNSTRGGPSLVVEGNEGHPPRVLIPHVWDEVRLLWTENSR
jgi:predicted ABC-type ATPase